MIPIIFFIRDPFHIILPDITSFLLTEKQISIASSHTFSPSTSLLSVINPFTSLSIPFGQFLDVVSASSAFSLIAFRLLFCFIFHAFVPSLILLSIILTQPYVLLSFLKLPPSPLYCTTRHLLYFFCPSSSITAHHLPLKLHP